MQLYLNRVTTHLHWSLFETWYFGHLWSFWGRDQRSPQARFNYSKIRWESISLLKNYSFNICLKPVFIKLLHPFDLFTGLFHQHSVFFCLCQTNLMLIHIFFDNVQRIQTEKTLKSTLLMRNTALVCPQIYSESSLFRWPLTYQRLQKKA